MISFVHGDSTVNQVNGCFIGTLFVDTNVSKDKWRPEIKDNNSFVCDHAVVWFQLMCAVFSLLCFEAKHSSISYQF